MLLDVLVSIDRPTKYARLVAFALVGACAHATTPREPRAFGVCTAPMSSADEVCACLIAHVKTTPAGEGRELTCHDGTPIHVQTAELPLSVVLIAGARQPLAYLVHTPDTGQRRVLAAVPGGPGMRFYAVVTSSFPTEPGYPPYPSPLWPDGRHLIQVTTEWRGSPRGLKSLTLCLVKPAVEGRASADVPSCAFTTLFERYLITGPGPGPNHSMPDLPQMDWDKWAVAADPKCRVVLVVQVAGERDRAVPTGAFRID